MGEQMSNQFFYGYAPTPVPSFTGHVCDNCGDLIEKREQCIDLFPGLLDESTKSGNAVVISDGIEPDAAEFPRAIVHPWCAEEFCARYYSPPVAGTCEACGVNLDGSEETELCHHCEGNLSGDGR
jgi:hypothetical protein